MEIKKAAKLPQIYECIFCDYTTSRKNDYANHILTLKHKNRVLEKDRMVNGQNFPQKSPNFHCVHCNFTTLQKGKFDKHKNTLKHIKILDEKKNKNECPNCYKQFVNASGLWKHKQKCLLN